MDIIYVDAYKKIGLTESELSPMTSSLYGFIGDHVIPQRDDQASSDSGRAPSSLDGDDSIPSCGLSISV